MPTLGSRMISQISATATAEITIGMKMIVRKKVDPLGMPRSRMAASTVPMPTCSTIEPSTMMTLLRSATQKIGSRGGLGVVAEADEVPVLRGQPEGDRTSRRWRAPPG